uniref:Protein kinase domain-containing protein n=1 Tax=Meloidogyne hapla TaxID=6305 RepID=A0A1I8BP19_MELHA
MVLEKAKSNIRDCYEKIQEDSELDILIKIVKGAARALAQLHEYEFVHLNVKTESFVYTEIPENENEVENCKLTGLEKANLSSQEACDHHKYDEIPTMDKILDFLNGVIDLSTFQNPEYGRHYKQGESSHGGHEVGGGSTGHEHELASTSHAQHSYGGDSQVPGVQEHESRQSPGCNFFGCFTGRGGRD